MSVVNLKQVTKHLSSKYVCVVFCYLAFVFVTIVYHYVELIAYNKVKGRAHICKQVSSFIFVEFGFDLPYIFIIICFHAETYSLVRGYATDRIFAWVVRCKSFLFVKTIDVPLGSPQLRSDIAFFCSPIALLDSLGQLFLLVGL